jgi:predicted transcriptional regulator
LSIKPHFAEAILNGVKKFEFRRKLFKDEKVDTIVIYASKPVAMVVGEFSVDEILTSHPDDLWQVTESASGIDREYFDRYFLGCERGHAIRVGTVVRYESPKNLEEAVNLRHPPQSFCYVTTSATMS